MQPRYPPSGRVQRRQLRLDQRKDSTTQNRAALSDQVLAILSAQAA